ncbi:hypothetical protein [Streptomyces cinereoruber]
MTSPGPTGGTPVTKWIEPSITGGCLVFLTLLIVVGGSLVTVLGYALWKSDNTTEENRTAAKAELHDLIDHAARGSAGALSASATTDPAALAALIGKHTEAPVITYDAARKEFTAVVEKATAYQTASMLGGGSDQITSCAIFTYTLGPDRAWRVDVTTREAIACRSSREVGRLARGAREVLEDLDDDLTAVAQAQRALDRTRPLGRLAVKRVAYDEHTTTVSALLANTARTIDQCYLFTLPRPGNQAPSPVTATPAASC